MFLSQLLVFVALLTAQQLHAVEPVEIDYARADQREAWLRDAACGEASCDAFVHDPQPVMRGSAEMAWSVNPSLTIDRTSGAWYAYVGCYPSGYTLRPPPEHMHSRLWRSHDRGATWEALGPVLPERFTLSGVRSPMLMASPAKPW